MQIIEVAKDGINLTCSCKHIAKTPRANAPRNCFKKPTKKNKKR